MTSRYMHPLQEKLIHILEGWGIDPYQVRVAELGETGYLTFALDADGHRQWDDDGEFIVEAHEWPKGFPIQEFLADFNEWQGQVGR